MSFDIGFECSQFAANAITVRQRQCVTISFCPQFLRLHQGKTVVAKLRNVTMVVACRITSIVY